MAASVVQQGRTDEDRSPLFTIHHKLCKDHTNYGIFQKCPSEPFSAGDSNLIHCVFRLHSNDSQFLYGNIMYDRRVVRGNTYAQQTLPTSSYVDPVEVQRQREIKRREVAKKRAKQQLHVRSPEPVEGRKHVELQTELYLEELSDRVEEAEMECQTDAFLDRAPSPMFVPAKSGVDKETQILEGELFDFNVEVLPVLEVLVGKIMEQSLVEVMEEEELANLREQQRVFEELRNAEMMEQERLQEQERRHREEKDRRMKQQLEMVKKEKETAEKIAAKAFAQSYLSDLVPSVFGTLAENGYFYDPIERNVETSFMPWLMDQVDNTLQKSVRSRKILDTILREVVHQRLKAFTQLEMETEKEAETKPDQTIAENETKVEVEVEEQDNTEETTAAKDEDAANDEDGETVAAAETERTSEDEKDD